MNTDSSVSNGTLRFKRISLRDSITFIISRPQLFAWTVVLLSLTALLTFLGYSLLISWFEDVVGTFFKTAPKGAVVRAGWYILLWLYLIATRLIAFYIALLVSYSLTSPGYMFLSGSTEKLVAGGSMEDSEGFDWSVAIDDFIEGVKIAVLGIGVSIVLFFVSFVPVLGIVTAFTVLVFYSALLFIDFPSSRRHWTLSQKMSWIYRYPVESLRLGFLPAVIGMVPVFNVLFIALFFPLFVVHATRVFLLVEYRDISA